MKKNGLIFAIFIVMLFVISCGEYGQSFKWGAKKIGNIKDINDNNREVFYLSFLNDNNWQDKLPNNNWCLFVYGDDWEKSVIEKVAKVCVDKNVCYVCTAGKKSELLHDIFDSAYYEKHGYETEDTLMTTCHDNYEEGFWFALIVAHEPKEKINNVICLDLNKKSNYEYNKLLIDKMNKGWLPPD